MAYEHERDEWRYDLRRTTTRELDDAQNARRHTLGIIGDKYDACEGHYPDDDDE